MKMHQMYSSFLVFLLGCNIRFTEATFSLVATDSKTRQVGGVGASCVLGADLYEALYISAPNRSVLHTQGLYLPRDPESPIITLAREYMNSGNYTVQEILASMKSVDNETETLGDDGMVFDFVEARQYIIANFESATAYTGAEMGFLYKEFGFPDSEIDTEGMAYDDRYIAISGGNLVSDGTVAAMQDGFANAAESQFAGEIDDLAGRLMSALHEVIAQGLGDVRCKEGFNTTATGAYLHIDNPDGSTHLHINIVDTMAPVVNVGDAFLEWRDSGATSGWVFEIFPPSFPSLFSASHTAGGSFFLSLVLAGLVAVAATIS